MSETTSDRTAEQATLETADGLFYERGVAAVTMAEIRTASGVSLRRLYSMYPSKANLVSAWLNHRHSGWMKMYAELVEARLAAGDTPVDAIFAALETWMINTDFRGCGFINTHAELGELTDEQRNIISMHKRSLAGYLQSTALPGTDAASGLAPLVDGAIVQASIFRDPEPIRAANRLARGLEDITS